MAGGRCWTSAAALATARREPESRAPALNPHPIEAYATAATGSLLRALAPAGRAVPALWLEPGRYLVGNGLLLLAMVGTVKRDLGHVWVHVDASTNNLMRIDTSRAWYHILPATRMDAAVTETVEIVGGTCIPSVLGVAAPAADIGGGHGDVVAVLDDAGMYAEAISNQFNALGRPATVLVSDAGADVIKRRETITEVFAQHVVPAHLQAERSLKVEQGTIPPMKTTRRGALLGGLAAGVVASACPPRHRTGPADPADPGKSPVGWWSRRCARPWCRISRSSTAST